MKLVIITITVVCFLFLSHGTSAQSGKIPPFRILQSNGKVFKPENLPMEKPIMIIYFSPECDHCTKFLKEFFKRAAEFRKPSIVMITFLSPDKVAKFVNDFNVNSYPNIIVGTEGTSFFVKNYYKVHDMPFVALHDKMGNLVQLYQKEIPINDMVQKLNRLK